MIITEKGLTEVCFYFLVRVFRKAVLLRSDKVLHLALAVIAMALFPFIQSLNAAILFWIYIWGFFHGYERGQQ